ncbi:MAG TPA: hypothetical protein DCM28_18985 [Phycisphaerales bacterium]|nr:hypothetical protein [Phycisphaerales bacterium]
MQNTALPADITPYCVPETVSMEIRNAEDVYINNMSTAEAAAKRAADRVNGEIQRTLIENPELKAQYDKAMKDQKKIEEFKKNGQKIPASLIQNPFYLRYYRVKGMLKEEE